MYYYLTAFGAALFVAAVVLPVALLARKTLPVILKILSLCFAALFYVRYCLGHDNISDIYNLTLTEGFTSRGQLAGGLFQVWLMFTAELLLFLYPYFQKKVPSLNVFASTLAPAVFLVNLIFLRNHILSIDGFAAAQGYSVRGAMIAAETGTGLAYSLLILAFTVRNFRSDAKNWPQMLLALVGMVACTMPNYAPQLLLNPYDFSMKAIDLTFYHRLYIYPAFIIPIVLYFFFRHSSYDVKKFGMLYYSLAILCGFTLIHKFDIFSLSRAHSWPLHLCNTALYITPLCLIFNWKKFFYFTYYMNVLGAFLAITMPDYGLGGLGGSMIVSYTVEFYRDHYQAFFMPLLVVELGIFKRPGVKDFRYSLVGFAGYFLLVLIINGWMTNYDPGVDYFFLNSDFIAKKFGSWAQNLRNFVWEFDIGSLHFKYYPVYQSLFFIVYVSATFAMWFVYEFGFRAVHSWQDLFARRRAVRADALALSVALGGRSKEEPMDTETTDKLILDHFTKRYAKSDVYAVKDACLEVSGGEIFGFLGPNGAGKSTIIKSVVGIQTITEGTIRVCGYDVRMQPVQAKRCIGFVPDHYALYERLTAREYINYIADLYEVPQQERDERLNRFIQLFEFESAIDNQIKTYSHGMKQKVTIMAALIHNPKVWILDEPLTGLDPNSIFQVKECMKQHAAAGNIVFFSSHIIDVVERICDKIAIICKGQIQCVRDVKELEAQGETLEEFYMRVINGREVAPVRVGDDTPDDGAEQKQERSLFKKKKKRAGSGRGES